MKRDTDAKLLALLAIVMLSATLFAFAGVRSVEHLFLARQAQEIAARWSSALSSGTPSDGGGGAQFPHHGIGAGISHETMDMASATSSIVEMRLYDPDGNLLTDLSPPRSKDGNRHLHSFWKHLSPFHTREDGRILVAAEALLPGGGRLALLADLTGEARHLADIGNLAFLTMASALGFITVLGGTLVVRNGRQRHRQAAELAAAKAAAEEANRSKSAFLANVSHEVRSPLNAINGFSEIMAGEMFGPLGTEKYREYAKDIHESGQLLLTLINDILDLSKAEAGKLELHEEKVDIPNLASRVEKLVVERAGKAGIILRNQIEEPLPAIRADERKLLQILLNLLTNAIKFTPSGGVVTLQAERPTDGGLRLIVRDTGIGIAPGDIAKVLEPFGQVDDPRVRRQEGTGLGVPLSKRLVELHGGRFLFESEPGVGTTVTVALPESRILADASGKS